MKSKTRPIIFNDIDPEARSGFLERLASHTVSLLAGDDQGGDYIGSGVLTRLGSHFGILSAKHVVESHRFRKCDQLMISFLDCEHQFSLETRSLSVYSPDPKAAPEYGQEFAFISLPDVSVGWLKAKKEFVELSLSGQALESRLKDQLPDSYFIVGTPQQFVEKYSYRSENRNVNVVSTMNQALYCELEAHFNHDGIDYFDMILPIESSPEMAIRTFKGVSGGGLWHTRLFTPEQKCSYFDEPLLVGIAFYEMHNPDGRARIRCQALKSLYDDFVPHLKEWLGSP